MIFQIIKIISISFLATIKAIIASLIGMLPTISLLSNISKAFSYPAIICGLLGIPISFVFIVKFLIKKFSVKKNN